MIDFRNVYCMSKKSCIFSSLSIQCKLDRTTWTWCTRSVEISCIFTFRMNLCEFQTVCLVHLYIVNTLCKWTRLLGNTVELLIDSYIVCPRSDPFYVVTYYIKWATTSWTHSSTYRSSDFLYIFLKIIKASHCMTKFMFWPMKMRILVILV